AGDRILLLTLSYLPFAEDTSGAFFFSLLMVNQGTSLACIRKITWTNRTGVRAKTPTAQVNEVLCKVLCHNICILIQSIYELGLEPTFWTSKTKGQLFQNYSIIWPFETKPLEGRELE
ncbi:MAG: Transposase, partial [Dehalococcoidia bacterium]|nr:Transposase [Dehalococcoidia bacterium]